MPPPRGGARALAKTQPRSANTHHELGLTLAALGEGGSAIHALRRAVSLKRDMPDAWRALGDQLSLSGDGEAADLAYAEHIRASVKEPLLMKAAQACATASWPGRAPAARSP